MQKCRKRSTKVYLKANSSSCIGLDKNVRATFRSGGSRRRSGNWYSIRTALNTNVYVYSWQNALFEGGYRLRFRLFCGWLTSYWLPLALWQQRTHFIRYLKLYKVDIYRTDDLEHCYLLLSFDYVSPVMPVIIHVVADCRVFPRQINVSQCYRCQSC